MKRSVFFYLAASLFITGLYSSCTNIESTGDPIVPGNEVTTIQAVNSDALLTKTILSGGKIYWMQGDEINLFYGDQSSGKFVTATTVPTVSTTFSGQIAVVEGHAENSTEPYSFWAIYPYDAANSSDGSSVTMTIPSEQGALEDSFANGLNPAIAKSFGLLFSFYNVGSWYAFTVQQSGITSVTLNGANGEGLTGKVRVTMDEDNRPACTVLEGVDHITMQAPSGGFVPGKEYRMVLIPQTLAGGYTLTLYKGNASAQFVETLSREFVRNSGRRKANVDNGLSFSGIISFTDATVKQLCVTNWDTNGDGEISFEEAAAVTDIGTVFKGQSISSFDELQYFISLPSIPASAFQGCTQLSSIAIPSSVQTIGDNAFSGCTGLTKIVIPANVTGIGTNAFSNCSAIVSITIEATNPPTLGNNALNTGAGFVLHVPETATDPYANAPGWSSFATSIASTPPEYVDMGLSVKWAKCNMGV